ncbi:hydrogenase expression/formation protein HypC [Cricetibacter osteomyelitidis]|uniref:Hydrogenase expression/formation protein HypC n=1 Tax=Cricetibacter osteomyelitidis TaxID=1521931 RepID=A0A4R2T0A1_9PAST|nr:hydrogenase maturation factor HybG [Cricetibacter osteomyelitidis]TCP94701.1 hydrogenase expression/formation protein HypC [Cricetibacter osteomyelitidis]
MCLGVPGQIVKIGDNELQLATVDVCGVQREVNISLVCDDDVQNLLGKWVLVHVGFAMSIIDEEEARQTQEALIAMSQLEHEVGDFLGLNGSRPQY